MGLIIDFLRFLGAVLFRSKEDTRVYLEELDMAERYVRWGEDRKDVKDFLKATEHLDGCQDEMAPKSDLVLRKYRVYLNAVTYAVQMMLLNNRKSRQELLHKKTQLREEIKAINDQIDENQKKADAYREDGDMIAVRELDRTMTNQRARVEGLNNMLNSGDVEFRISGEYDALLQESERLCMKLETGVADLQELENMDRARLEELRSDVWARLENLRDMVREAVPAESRPAPSDSE